MTDETAAPGIEPALRERVARKLFDQAGITQWGELLAFDDCPPTTLEQFFARADEIVALVEPDLEALELRSHRLRGKLSAAAETIGLDLGGGADGYLIPNLEVLVARVATTQRAVDIALSAARGTANVGGPTQEEALRTVIEQLEPLAMEQKGAGEVRDA